MAGLIFHAMRGSMGIGIVEDVFVGVMAMIRRVVMFVCVVIIVVLFKVALAVHRGVLDWERHGSKQVEQAVEARRIARLSLVRLACARPNGHLLGSG